MLDGAFSIFSSLSHHALLVVGPIYRRETRITFLNKGRIQTVEIEQQQERIVQSLLGSSTRSPLYLAPLLVPPSFFLSEGRNLS